MEREIYEAPVCEIIVIEGADVITGSPDDGGPWT